MKFFYLLGISLFCLVSLPAQRDIDGLWEGTITFGGIHSDESYKFQLFLKARGRKVSGKSQIHVSTDEIIEMEVSGTMFGDRSVYLEEFKFVPIRLEEEKVGPAFYRKYQFLHNRSIWESKLEGYWQEIINEPFAQGRRRGRIKLTRVKRKAKP